MNAAADSNLSTGAFAIACTIAASMESGTVSLSVLTCGTGSIECLAMIACILGPVNGGSPASIS